MKVSGTKAAKQTFVTTRTAFRFSSNTDVRVSGSQYCKDRPDAETTSWLYCIALHHGYPLPTVR